MVKVAMSLDLEAISGAHERIRPYIHRTPVLTSSRLDAARGASLFFKCENFQKIGAFKARGATNAVFALDDRTARRGVATHSSGNHGAALARAAKLRGVPAHIVMPSNSAKVKVRAVETYGAHIVFCEPTEAARESACANVIAKTGATLIHSLDRKSTRLNSSHDQISYAVFCLKKKKNRKRHSLNITSPHHLLHATFHTITLQLQPSVYSDCPLT